MNGPQIVSEQEWQAARAALLVKGGCRWSRLDADKYEFTAPDGNAVSLAGLFADRRQLLIYHDNKSQPHLNGRDTRLILMARAPRRRSSGSGGASAGRRPGTRHRAPPSMTTWG